MFWESLSSVRSFWENQEMVSDTLMKKFKKGEALYGPFASLCSCDAVEMFGLAGFDFVIVDCEHGASDPNIAQNMLRAADSHQLPAITRVPNAMPSTILKFLDIGSSGIMVPLVHTPEIAKQVAESARYCPRGKRGYASMRSAFYGFLDVPSHVAKTNAEVFVMVQAESVQAVENIDAIAATEGVDSVFVGTYDLSQSMGIPGQVNDPKMVTAIEKVVKSVRAAGKVAGIYAGTVENAKRYVGLGYQFIAYSGDVGMLAGAARDSVKALKGK